MRGRLEQDGYHWQAFLGTWLEWHDAMLQHDGKFTNKVCRGIQDLQKHSLRGMSKYVFMV